MKKFLLAGGSHSDIPMIKAARAYGYQVVTSGNRAEDLGHAWADEVHLVDFSDKEALLALARDLKVDAICSSSNDFSVISCAYVAEQLGLPGFDPYETTLTLHHKDRFRKLAAEIGLKCPRAISLTLSEYSPDILKQRLAGMTYPLMVKPIDLTGGKGISRVDEEAQLATAVDKAFDYSKAKRIVIETFFAGTLHSYSTVIKNGRVVFEYADNEFSFKNPYLVSTSTSPAQVAPELIPLLRANTEHLAATLKLGDGVLHAQFLANGQDFTLIEYTRRCPGDFYPVPVLHSTGVDQADMLVRPCLGLEIIPPESFAQQGFYSRHCIMSDRPGVISAIQIADELRDNVMDIFPLRKPGDAMTNHWVDKAAIIFLKYDSEAEMVSKNRNINALATVTLEETNTPS